MQAWNDFHIRYCLQRHKQAAPHKMKHPLTEKCLRPGESFSLGVVFNCCYFFELHDSFFLSLEQQDFSFSAGINPSTMASFKAFISGSFKYFFPISKNSFSVSCIAFSI